MKSLFQTRKLSTVYPDISGQLCNKHVKRLSKLKSTFKNIYMDMEPEGYVLVNGMAKVIDLGQDLHLSFALENGVTVLYSKTYLNEDIFINGNHMKLELIFNSKGQHSDGIHQKIDQIKNLMNLIRKKSGQQKEFYGGIIYVHVNISENMFGFQQCVMTSIALSLILVHDQLTKYTQQSLIQLVCQADPTLSKKMISNLVQKYALSNMFAETTFTQQKKEEEEHSTKRIRPRARTEIVDRPVFGQIMNQPKPTFPNPYQDFQKLSEHQNYKQCMKIKIQSPIANGDKENYNSRLRITLPHSNQTTEKSILEENISSFVQINIHEPSLNSERSIFCQLSNQCIQINLHTPSQENFNQWKNSLMNSSSNTEKTISNQNNNNQFLKANHLTPSSSSDRSISATSNQNLRTSCTSEVYQNLKTSCTSQVSHQNLKISCNTMASYSNLKVSFNSMTSHQNLKTSLNSMTTAQEQSVVDVVENQPDPEEGSSFGSLEKIQSYQSQELRSLHVKLKDSQKLVFCKLEISKGQEYDFSSKMESISKINQFLQEQGISRSELINQNGQVTLPKELKELLGQDESLVEYCQQMKNLLFLLASKSIQFDRFVKLKYELDRKFQIYDGEVDEILQKLQASNKFIQNFCIIEGAVLLISMDKLYYAQMMIFLRKLLKESKLSTEKYIATAQNIEDDDKYEEISETMFTAMPSAGYAIYKPTEEENFWI